MQDLVAEPLEKRMQNSSITITLTHYATRSRVPTVTLQATPPDLVQEEVYQGRKKIPG